MRVVVMAALTVTVLGHTAVAHVSHRRRDKHTVLPDRRQSIATQREAPRFAAARSTNDADRKAAIGRAVGAALADDDEMAESVRAKDLNVVGFAESTLTMTKKAGTSVLDGQVTTGTVAASGTSAFPKLFDVLHRVFAMCVELKAAEWCDAIMTKASVETPTDNPWRATLAHADCNIRSNSDMQTAIRAILTSGDPGTCLALTDGTLEKKAKAKRPLDHVYRAVLETLTGVRFTDRENNDRAYCFEKKSVVVQFAEIVPALVAAVRDHSGARGYKTTVKLEAHAYSLDGGDVVESESAGTIAHSVTRSIGHIAPCSDESADLHDHFCSEVGETMADSFGSAIAEFLDPFGATAFAAGDKLTVSVDLQDGAASTSVCTAKNVRNSVNLVFRCAAPE